MSTPQESGPIETSAEFKQTPVGQGRRWYIEFLAEKKAHEKWRDQASKSDDKFIDKRHGTSSVKRLNLFTADISLLAPSLMGNPPEVGVTREHYDADDDVARVAAEILERLLNNTIQLPDDTTTKAMRNAVKSLLVAGISVARVRYDATFEDQSIPAIIQNGVEMAPAVERQVKTSENVPIEVVAWQDFKWSSCRTWQECRWVAFRAMLARDSVIARFGEDKERAVSYETPSEFSQQASEDGGSRNDPYRRCEIWEIWDKETMKVYWYNPAAKVVLDQKEDPLRLPGFFPCPEPVMLFTGTKGMVPRTWYYMYQDMYNSIDRLTTRIHLLEKAVKAVGVYDSSATGVQRMLTEGTENTLIPVDSWALFAERGGLKGAVDWMPILDIVQALDKLRDVRREEIELLRQISGISDLMRGQATNSGATATERRLQAAYGSVRVQDMQDRFAEFAAAVQRLRSHVMLTLYDDETIIMRSNVRAMPPMDQQMVGQAIAVLRSPQAQYRINIDPSKLATLDYQQVMGERIMFLDGIIKFTTAVAPLAQQLPQAMPFVLEMLKWGMSGFRGASSIEGVVDQAIAQANMALKQKAQTQQNPELIKAQGKMAEVQAKARAKMDEIRAKSQADAAKIEQELQADLMKLRAETETQAGMAQLDTGLEIRKDESRQRNQALWNIQEEIAESAADEKKFLQQLYLKEREDKDD